MGVAVDSIRLTPPETIRALDLVQRLLAAGWPSAGLADTLAQQGISYLVGAHDSSRDFPVGAATAGASCAVGPPRPDGVAAFFGEYLSGPACWRDQRHSGS